jgi:hypothetical protein
MGRPEGDISLPGVALAQYLARIATDTEKAHQEQVPHWK